MFIPSNFCPASLMKRDLVNNVSSTAEAFKSWDTCMANTGCKAITIVLIVLGSLLVLWALSTIIRCMCMGMSCLQALCCCCRPASKQYEEKHPYNNPNMYGPAAQPAYQPAYQNTYDPPGQPGYRPYGQSTTRSASANAHESYYQPSNYGYANTGYEPVDSDYDNRNPFNERPTAYRGNQF